MHTLARWTSYEQNQLQQNIVIHRGLNCKNVWWTTLTHHGQCGKETFHMVDIVDPPRHSTS